MEDQKQSGNIQKSGSGGFMDPVKIIDQIEIKEGDVVADFGCGAGYFTIPVAKKIGNAGKIYAIDVLTSSLETVESKAKSEGLLNVKTVRANLEVNNNAKLDNQMADFIVLANTLYQVNSNSRSAILVESKRVLKNNGRLAVIDWIPGKNSLGIKDEHCVPEEEIKKLAVDAGFRLDRSFVVDGSHYGLLFYPFG